MILLTYHFSDKVENKLSYAFVNLFTLKRIFVILYIGPPPNANNLRGKIFDENTYQYNITTVSFSFQYSVLQLLLRTCKNSFRGDCITM